MRLAGIHSLKILDTGLRRYDGCVVEHCKLRADKSEDCLSAVRSAAPAKLKRTETPQANTAGWPFFWTLFYGHSKKRTRNLTESLIKR